MLKYLTRLISAIAWISIMALPADADSIADFYRGKQLTIDVGSSAGGPYDIAARIMAHYLGKFIPGSPTIVVQNMPGAGGLLAVNNVVNLAPADGTVIGAPQSGTALEPIYHLLSPGGRNAKFDGTKLQWLGSAEQAVYILTIWHDSPIRTLDDLRQKEILVGASTPNADEFVFAKLVNNVFDTKMKIISGYGSSPDIALAMERGEVTGALFTYGSLMIQRPNWLAEGKARILLQLSLTPNASLKDVPFALDLVKNQADRQVLKVVLAKSKMARPYFIASGVPPERSAAIRTAFSEMLQDPAYLEDTKKAGMIVDPVSAETVQKTVEQVYQTPEPLLERVRKVIGGQN